MAALVVDASAVAALIFAEPGAEAVAERLRGGDLAAPGALRADLVTLDVKLERAFRRMR